MKKTLARADAATSVKKGSFTDQRDGKQYKTVKIGNQIWMAENLNYEVEGSFYYANDPANGDIYGRLYNWDAAVKACPAGWHLPSVEEWDELIEDVRGEEDKRMNLQYHKSDRAGFWYMSALRAKSGWGSFRSYNFYIGGPSGPAESGNGSDASGFSALPGGYYDGRYWDPAIIHDCHAVVSGDGFYGITASADWWSATEKYRHTAYVYSLDYCSLRCRHIKKSDGYSVRCVQDS
jgi:uncharacterized protein (TIGR02145 family)